MIQNIRRIEPELQSLGLGELDGFAVYYSTYRGHTTLGGAPPAVIYRGGQSSRPPKTAKMLPVAIERRVFAETRVTAYRLAA